MIKIMKFWLEIDHIITEFHVMDFCNVYKQRLIAELSSFLIFYFAKQHFYLRSIFLFYSTMISILN